MSSPPSLPANLVDDEKRVDEKRERNQRWVDQKRALERFCGASPDNESGLLSFAFADCHPTCHKRERSATDVHNACQPRMSSFGILLTSMKTSRLIHAALMTSRVHICLRAQFFGQRARIMLSLAFVSEDEGADCGEEGDGADGRGDRREEPRDDDRANALDVGEGGRRHCAGRTGGGDRPLTEG
eukprot:2516403-Pleurochrysis_carterae.AAC.4